MLGKLLKLETFKRTWPKIMIQLGCGAAVCFFCLMVYRYSFLHFDEPVASFKILSFGGPIIIVKTLWKIIKIAKGDYLRHIPIDIDSIDCDEYTAADDFSRAKSFPAKNMLKVGRLFTYYMDNLEIRAIPNSKIIWIYQNFATPHTNVYWKKKISYLIIFVHGSAESIEIPMVNSAATQMIISKLTESFPWIVSGYTDNLRQMFYYNRSNFLDMKYRKHYPNGRPSLKKNYPKLQTVGLYCKTIRKSL